MKIINITASRHAVFYSPLLALINGDFLANEGLKGIYHFPKDSINVYSKINSGEIDVAQSAVSGSWNYFEKNISLNIKHFALINSRDGFFIISKKIWSCCGSNLKLLCTLKKNTLSFFFFITGSIELIFGLS